MSAAVPEFEVRVADVGSLELGETRSFAYQQGDEPRSGFVIRHAEGYSAFANFCPHWRVDLDMGEGKFYAQKVDRIFCRNHGALFQPTTGVCDAGPCMGQSLLRFELKMDGQDAVVRIHADPYA